MNLNTRAVLLIGPPGSGKSSLTKLISTKLLLDSFQSGEVLRKVASQKSNEPLVELVKWRMARSLAMPIEVYCQIVEQELAHSIGGGVVFDGYPRTAEQGHALDLMLGAAGMPQASVSLIALDAPAGVLQQRVLARASCASCGADQDLKGQCCDNMSHSVRDDDTADRFSSRYAEYYETLPAIMSAVKRRATCCRLDATEPLDVLTRKVIGFLSAAV